MAMIAVRVGDNHAVELAYFGLEQLLAKIRPAIDEHALSRALYEDGGSQAVVAWFVRIALAPVVPDLRNAS